MLTDRYGLPTGAAVNAANDAYVEAIDLMLTQYPGALPALDRALELEPDFALAQVARARALQLGADAQGARAALASRLVTAQDSRASSQAALFGLILDGDGKAALSALHTHLRAWPSDALAVATSAGLTGLIAMSGHPNREEQLLAFLSDLAPHYGRDWWFDGHHAMALSELGHHEAARPLIERSIATQPRNAGAAHTYAHLHYETGEAAGATSYLRGFLAEYPRQGGLHGHLAWHLALTLLEQGEAEEAFRLYADVFAADDYPGPALIKVLDGPSFLWRAELAGYARDAAGWQALEAFARARFPEPGIPFADWHVALIEAVTGGGDRLARLEALVAAGNYAAGPVLPAIARGFIAFERQDWGGTIEAIAPLYGERHRMSGSRAQTDLVEFTLLRAYRAAGRTGEAEALISRRRPGPAAPLVQ